MDSLKLNNYLESLKKRETKSSAKTRTAELVEPFLKEIVWVDDTFFSDMTAFWVAVYTYRKWKTDDQLLKVMSWVKGKNLHPKQVCKVLYK